MPDKEEFKKLKADLVESALQCMGHECPDAGEHFLDVGFHSLSRGGNFHVGCYMCNGIVEISRGELRKVAIAWKRTGTLPRVHWAMTSLPRKFEDTTVRELANAG